MFFLFAVIAIIPPKQTDALTFTKYNFLSFGENLEFGVPEIISDVGLYGPEIAATDFVGLLDGLSETFLWIVVRVKIWDYCCLLNSLILVAAQTKTMEGRVALLLFSL